MTWVNLDLPEGVHEKAKKRAIDEKKNLRDFLIEAITREVA